MPPYANLPHFVRAAQLGNFSAVAREFGVSAVAISKSMAALEASLGVRLFNRSTRSVTLTAEGRNFYERCAEPVRAIDEASRLARQESNTPTGLVRVTCVRPFGRGYAIPLLQRFSRLYPQVQVEFSLDDRVVDLVQDGYDIGIRAGGDPPADSIAREVCPLPFVVCGSPEYLAHFGVPKQLGDLAKHNCMRLGLSARRDGGTAGREATAFTWRTGSRDAVLPVSVIGNFAANDFTALESAALGGLGLMQAPLPLVLPHFRAGSLRPVLPSALFHGPRIHLHYRSRKNQPQRVQLLIDFLLTQLRQQADLVGDARALCAPYWA
jgi:DNA-binding transcriptional LysR family regulator